MKNKPITGEVIDEEIMQPITSEEYLEETAQLYKQSDLGQFALAQRFYEIKSKKLYKPLYTSMREFIETELKGMGNSTASRLANIHEKFVLTLGLKKEEIGKAGWSVIAIALPIIKTAEDARYWLDIAQAPQMTKAAFQALVDEVKTGKTAMECKHEKGYLVRICPDCNAKFREYDIATIRDETIKEALHEIGIDITDEQAKHVLTSLAEKAYMHDPVSDDD